ncbi:MAG TPA: hypothetical protein VEZ50_07425 [Nodosilinea sp.]|nr:hypothetical protein [Nodosilinea sp.]
MLLTPGINSAFSLVEPAIATILGLWPGLKSTMAGNGGADTRDREIAND